MTKNQTRVWLISDARNDRVLEKALKRLPRGSGFVFRHYHLALSKRRDRFAELARLARHRRHIVALAGDARTARRWGADAVYGAPSRIAGARGMPRIATVHSLRELGAAHRARADAVMLSPVYPTRSHRNAKTMGPIRARTLARHALVPVIMLGGMTAKRARRMAAYGWAAIDGLTPP